MYNKSDYGAYLAGGYKGVAGVKVLKGDKKGPRLGIIAITHGNEFAGLEIFRRLETDIPNGLSFCGEIYLVSANISAYKKFIHQNDPFSWRYIDQDMNRIAGKPLKKTSEAIRFQQLQPIFDELDIVVDLHSLPLGTNVLGITDYKFQSDAESFLDVDYILIDGLEKQQNLISYIVKKGKPGFGLECGNHYDENGIQLGYVNVQNVMKYYGMLNGQIEINKKRSVLKFDHEIIPRTDRFFFLKQYRDFDMITPGEAYAVDGDKTIINDTETAQYIGILHSKIGAGVGCGFIFAPVSN